MKQFWISFLFFQAMALPSSFAQLKLADIFSSRMVIQQQTQLNVWGWATPGSTVQITCSWSKSVLSVADGSGKWQTGVQTPKASLIPVQISVISGADGILLTDVLVGEVWLCSSQSNMEWSVADSTARMGKDPKTSMLNRNNQLHAVSYVS